MNTAEVRAKHIASKTHTGVWKGKLQTFCIECTEPMPCPSLQDADAWDALTERVRLAESRLEDAYTEREMADAACNDALARGAALETALRAVEHIPCGRHGCIIRVGDNHTHCPSCGAIGHEQEWDVQFFKHTPDCIVRLALRGTK